MTAPIVSSFLRNRLSLLHSLHDRAVPVAGAVVVVFELAHVLLDVIAAVVVDIFPDRVTFFFPLIIVAEVMAPIVNKIVVTVKNRFQRNFRF